MQFCSPPTANDHPQHHSNTTSRSGVTYSSTSDLRQSPVAVKDRHMSSSAFAPFMTMGTSDYHPYRMHAAQESAPIRRRNDNLYTSSRTRPLCNGSTTAQRFYPTNLSTMSALQPRPVQRVDSGFDATSEASSVTSTENVERVRAAKLYLNQYYGFEAAYEDDDEDVFMDEGSLGLMHIDSTQMNAERASTWEKKAVRARRNRKSKLKMAKKWLKRKLVPELDRRSWYLTL